MSQEIIEIEEDISNKSDDIKRRFRSSRKPKNTFKEWFKELEQEQLIINHSLAEECKKHDIDPQMIKLIPISQDLEYDKSFVVYNSRNLPSLSNYTNKYRNFIKSKNKKLNEIKNSFITFFSHLHAEDEENKEIEEKILIPGRIKLAKLANNTASRKDEYFKTLTDMLEVYEVNITHWRNQGRSDILRKLDTFRKEYVELSLKEFEIPIRTES